jgi:hypothetical protein
VTVICAMTLFDYLSAWSVVQRDGEQLIPRPSKARMLGAALYSIEPGMIALDKRPATAAVLRTWRRFLCTGPAGARFRPGGIVSTTSVDRIRQAEVGRPKVGTGINLPWNGFLR